MIPTTTSNQSRAVIDCAGVSEEWIKPIDPIDNPPMRQAKPRTKAAIRCSRVALQAASLLGKSTAPSFTSAG
jgi:hypothetical protein